MNRMYRLLPAVLLMTWLSTDATTSIAGNIKYDSPNTRETLVGSDYGLGISGMIDPDSGGLLVREVEEKSRAAGIGLEAEDVIVAVNGRRIRTLNDWKQALSKRTGMIRLDIRARQTKRLVVRTVSLEGTKSR